MKITVHTKTKEYPVIQERGILKRAEEVIGRSGHVFLISDDGVPVQWQNILQKQYPQAHMHIFPHGEENKNMTVLQDILADMLDHHVSRNDTVIVLGGGVAGDMGGFAAACYMRGIRYVNIPTTTLSMIDSSIGGKTAVDLHGHKNSVGAFWQPDMVLIDPDTLSTLPKRHVVNGLAEAVKEGMICDEKLFAVFEKDDYMDHLDEIICRCLEIKRDIVERDERESGERKLLNFGHTFGHAYESVSGLHAYLHGECVAMGMMTVLADEEIRARLRKVLERMGLPVRCQADPQEVMRMIRTDKKADHDTISLIQVHQIGKGTIETWTMEETERKLHYE